MAVDLGAVVGEGSVDPWPPGLGQGAAGDAEGIRAEVESSHLLPKAVVGL